MGLFTNIRHSISRKLLIKVFSIYLLITFAVTLFHIYEEYQYTKKSVYNEVVSLEDTFTIPLSNAIWDYNISQRDILLKNIHGISIISGVQLFSKENLLLKEYGEIDNTISEVYSFPLKNQIKNKDNWLGYVKLYSTEQVVIDRVKVGFMFIVVNSIIKTFLLWFLFLWVFDKLLSRPLNELSEQVSKIDLDHLENNVTLRSYHLPQKPNELELFKGRFSEMLNKMLISKKQLDSLNETLDEKVQIKTQELQESLDDFKTLLNSTIEGVIIFDEERKCIDLNDTVLEIFGYESKEEVLGKYILDFAHEDSLDEIKKRIQLKETSLYEVKLLRKNKEPFPVLAKGVNTKVLGRDMRITAIIDLSELKEKESMLLQSTKLAAMGEMIGNIAHQWRQPLSVISTAASGLEIRNEIERVSDEDISKSCKIIDENSQYLSQTIDDFSDFIKGDRKKVEFNLYNNVESFLNLVVGTQKQYHITIEKDIHKDIQIISYPNELIQCYINFFNNAKDAFVQNNIEENSRYIFISQQIKDDKIIIEFKDNAGGIPDEVIKKVFEPYFTTKHQAQGTGLGLHMTYNLVVNGMSGNIKVSNVEYEFNDKLYKGASFLIELPLRAKD